MNYSSLLVFSFSFFAVVNLSLTGPIMTIQGGRYTPPPHGDIVTNIANGLGRRNVFVISDNPNAQGNRPPGPANRFPDRTYTASPWSAPPRRIINNIGNGNHNQHTFNLGRTRRSTSSGYNGGTNLVAGSNTYNVGFGTNNQNFINGLPAAVNIHHVPNFASRSGTINNFGFGRNNRNTVNFKPRANLTRNVRNPQPQSNIDHATVNGVPIQPNHISPTGFRTYYVPSGQTISVISNSGRK